MIWEEIFAFDSDSWLLIANKAIDNRILKEQNKDIQYKHALFADTG